MPKAKLLKKIFMEVFQWTAFATPIFVTGQRFASKECLNGCPGVDNTEYWVLIAGIIAYVAGITLVVWLPVKIFVVWKKVISPYKGLWFPGNLMYILFSATPSVAFVLMGHEYCVQNDETTCFDYFTGAPLETFVIMLVVTDWSEKIRYINLRSDDDSMRKNKYTSASWDRGRSSRRIDTGITDNGEMFGASRRSSMSHASLLHQGARDGTTMQRLARKMKWTDARPENLLRDVMLAYDTRLLLDLSLLDDGNGEVVFQTTWVYAIYILSVISFFPLVFAPNSDMRSCTTVIFQDIPFFVFRLAIFSAFGSGLVLQTSVLFLLKNFFVGSAFIYFNVIVPWRNAKLKSHEYELRRLSENPRRAYEEPATIDRRIETPGYPMEMEGRNPNAIIAGGISNPAYQSKRYESSPAATREFRNDYYQEEWEDPNDVDPPVIAAAATEMYASQFIAPSPERQLARVESVIHRVPETHLEASSANTYVTHYQEPQESPKSDAAPPNASKPSKNVIDYDTINDPGSFLYSQDGSPKKPTVYTIDFEAPTPPEQPETSYQKSSVPAVVSTSVPPNNDVLGRENSEDPQTSKPAPKQAPNATVDNTKKLSRRKAPPPPTQFQARVKTPAQQSSSVETFPPPPPEILNEKSQTQLPNGRIGNEPMSEVQSPPKKDSSTKIGIQQMLAEEAYKRRMTKEQTLKEQQALKELDDANEYGTNIGRDWSRSTTPKSTYSTKQNSNAPVINDEDYDDRL